MEVLRDRHAGTEVLVFVPNWIQAGTGPHRLSHLLLPTLGALRARGLAVRLLQEAFDGAPQPDWRRWIAAASVAVVWCAEMYPAVQIPGLEAFVALCRAHAQPPLVVGGGFFPLVDTERLELDPRVAVIVHGPGEVVLPELVATLAAGRAPNGIAGITYRTDAGWRNTGPARRRALDPAFLGPLYELDLRAYLHAEPLIFENDLPSLQVHTGSGCAKRCPFCFDESTPYGVFPAAAIIDALAMLRARYGLRQVQFGELDFFHKTARALAVARGILERGIDLRWFALGSVCDLARLGAEDLALLARSGCHRIEMGTESGSPAMLARLGKRHGPQDALRVVERLAAAGIATTHNLLFGAPGETPADRLATLRMALALRARDRRTHVNFRVYQAIPNTPTGALAVQALGRFPRTLAELREYRVGLRDGQRALPWLSAADERFVADVTTYLGPMAVQRRGADTLPARALRLLARLRCRFGLRLGLAADRSAAAWLALPVAQTYVP